MVFGMFDFSIREKIKRILKKLLKILKMGNTIFVYSDGFLLGLYDVLRSLCGVLESSGKF